MKSSRPAHGDLPHDSTHPLLPRGLIVPMLTPLDSAGSEQNLAEAPWVGAEGAGGFFESADRGKSVAIPVARLVQDRARFTSRRGARYPSLGRVEIHFRGVSK
jgi:hypothetical protein